MEVCMYVFLACYVILWHFAEMATRRSLFLPLLYHANRQDKILGRLLKL